jgi:hypothetical protein
MYAIEVDLKSVRGGIGLQPMDIEEAVMSAMKKLLDRTRPSNFNIAAHASTHSPDVFSVVPSLIWRK